MSFRIHALPADHFQTYFRMSDEALASVQAVRMTVDARPGFPCRVSLADAEVGEQVILLNYRHQPADSPFRSSHAIYVRENAKQAFPEAGTVPEVLASRLISIRAFDERHFLVNADVVEGTELGDTIHGMFGNPDVSYLHLHYAKPGCFAARVTRS